MSLANRSMISGIILGLVLYSLGIAFIVTLEKYAISDEETYLYNFVNAFGEPYLAILFGVFAGASIGVVAGVRNQGRLVEIFWLMIWPIAFSICFAVFGAVNGGLLGIIGGAIGGAIFGMLTKYLQLQGAGKRSS